MLHIIWSVVVGFIIGLIARAIIPGGQEMSFLATALLGIAGSVVGGLVARLFSRPADGAAFHPAGFFLSIVTSVILLVLVLHFQHPQV